MRHKRGLVVAAIIACGWLMGCKNEPVAPAAVDTLATARSELAKADFGDDFDGGLAMLRALEEQSSDKPIRFGARLTRSEALMELWITVLLTEDGPLYEKLQGHLGIQLDGDAWHPRNFQLVAQSFLEDFRLVAREGKAVPALHDRAQALALFATGIQGVLFRGKADYFAGRDAVKAFPDLAHLDNLLAARDLIAETLTRTDGPEKNWQNVVLTVFGRVCPKAASRFLTAACTADASTTESEEYCFADFNEIPASRRARVEGFLAASCTNEATQDHEVTGATAIETYYDTALTGLMADDVPMRPTLKRAAKALVDRKAEAYAALAMFLK
jgi:hypothetical protein